MWSLHCSCNLSMKSLSILSKSENVWSKNLLQGNAEPLLLCMWKYVVHIPVNPWQVVSQWAVSRSRDVFPLRNPVAHGVWDSWPAGPPHASVCSGWETREAGSHCPVQYLDWPDHAGTQVSCLFGLECCWGDERRLLWGEAHSLTGTSLTLHTFAHMLILYNHALYLTRSGCPVCEGLHWCYHCYFGSKKPIHSPVNVDVTFTHSQCNVLSQPHLVQNKWLKRTDVENRLCDYQFQGYYLILIQCQTLHLTQKL